MTNEEAIKRLKQVQAEFNENWVDYGGINEAFEKAYQALEERPQGEWSDESKDSLLCSACGKRVYKPFIGGFPTERTSHYYPNFCAFCGADMRKDGAE